MCSTISTAVPGFGATNDVRNTKAPVAARASDSECKNTAHGPPAMDPSASSLTLRPDPTTRPTEPLVSGATFQSRTCASAAAELQHGSAAPPRPTPPPSPPTAPPLRPVLDLLALCSPSLDKSCLRPKPRGDGLMATRSLAGCVRLNVAWRTDDDSLRRGPSNSEGIGIGIGALNEDITSATMRSIALNGSMLPLVVLRVHVVTRVGVPTRWLHCS